MPSCIYSFWHGVIPTSYFIFKAFYTCILFELVYVYGAICVYVHMAQYTHKTLNLDTLGQIILSITEIRCPLFKDIATIMKGTEVLTLGAVGVLNLYTEVHV